MSSTLDHISEYREFEHDGEKWTLIGFKPRAENHPMLVRRAKDGDAYRFTLEDVTNGIADTDAPSTH